MTTNEQKEKKSPRIKEMVEAVGLVVTILIAGTSLLSNSGNLPLWWFDFSLIFLIMLTFFIPSVILYEPISERVKKSRLQRRRNTITRKHFMELTDLVYTSKRFNSSIRSIFNDLRTHYANKIKSQLTIHTLQSYNESEIRDWFFEIEKELNESNKTFRDVSLIMKHFEFVLKVYERNLKIIEEFVRGIQNVTKKPIAKGIEAEFEAFREKFNDFVKDFQDYCREVNKELGERKFPEWAIHRIKKW